MSIACFPIMTSLAPSFMQSDPGGGGPWHQCNEPQKRM